MIDLRYELEQLDENPEWLTVLETYDRLIDASKKENPDSEGWIPRLREFDDVENEDLSHIHGSLIAHGFLRFQIADRTSGMEYRLSQLGKQALAQGIVESDVEANVESADQNEDVDPVTDASVDAVEELENVVVDIDSTEGMVSCDYADSVDVTNSVLEEPTTLPVTSDAPVEFVDLTIESDVTNKSTPETDVTEADSEAA